MVVLVSTPVDASAGTADLITAIESVGSAANTRMGTFIIGSKVRFYRYDAT